MVDAEARPQGGVMIEVAKRWTNLIFGTLHREETASAAKGRKSMAGHWEHFPHGADVWIRGFGSKHVEAFAEAAKALTAVVVEPSTVSAVQAVEIACRGNHADDLFATSALLHRRHLVDDAPDPRQ